MLHLWQTENCLSCCQTELADKSKGALTAIQSLLLTFPLIYGLAEGLLYLWNGWHSAPEIISPGYEFALAFGLASFTAQCAQLVTVGLQDPIICVNISDERQQNHLCDSYAYSVKNCFPCYIWIYDLGFQFGGRWAGNNENWNILASA